jgi:DNA primase
MSGIPEELIEQVRDAADIVEIIGESVELKRTGSDYRGPCPFHSGKHRNMAVIPKKQIFYCFVCHEGGDVFTFFMKHLGMEYLAAVREVARRVGITIPDRPTGGPDPREPLFSAVSVAADWYVRRLCDADDAETARKYLANRGIDPEKFGPLGLGYAPRGNEFLDAMETLGIEICVLEDAGLLTRREDGSVRARFWNRLLFPIRDMRGRTVGFGGRVLGDGEPKYLNSPESQIFRKRQLLYNLDAAKHAIRKANGVVVVEGYFDVLRLVEVSIENVVAPLGTAFTEEQAHLIKRYCQDVVLLYDSDTAGLRATFRAADELLRAGLRVTIATLPPGEDPDTLAVSGGADAIRGLLDDGIDVFERKLQLLERKGWFGTLSGRRRALDRLVPTIRAATDPVTQDLYVDRTAEALGVSVESVRREASGRKRSGARSQSKPLAQDSSGAIAATSRSVPERDLLRVMLHAPEWRSRISESLTDAGELHQPEGDLITLIASADEAVPITDLLIQVDGAARLVLAELIEIGLGEKNVDAIVAGALSLIESRRLEAKKRAVSRQITVAAEDEKVKLLEEKVALNRESRKHNTREWNVFRRGGKSGAG